MEALREQHWPGFLTWARHHLGDFAPPGSPLHQDEALRTALSFPLARSCWNAMPLPRTGFRPEPVAEPGRNEPCPCGSGLKFKQCCQRAPNLGGFAPDMLWPLVIESVDEETRRAALGSRHLPREALCEWADRALEAGQFKQVVEWLEPQFGEPPRAQDELAGALLNLLCDALEQKRGGKRAKIALLERVSRLPQRSPLRSEAWQRLACIRMDDDRAAEAWNAFTQAQRDDPTNEALGMLEVQLLMGDGRRDEARDRARFHAAALRRRRGDVDPKVLEFYEELSRDPAGAMADVILNRDGAPGARLAACLERLAARPLPRYRLTPQSAADTSNLRESLSDRLRQMGVAASQIEGAVADLERQLNAPEFLAGADPEDAVATSMVPRPSHMLVTPPALTKTERGWREVFPLDKPFSVQPAPFDDAGVWEPETEARWSEYLERHNEAFDSLTILDDLATAMRLHPESDQIGVMERLAEPLLRRAVAILEGALADAPDAELEWMIADNRPVLRSLFRLMDIEGTRANSAQACSLAERLLRINPGDNHGLRYQLAGDYLARGDNEACVRLAAAYGDDPGPELRFNEALALFRLGRARNAGIALQRADSTSPRVKAYLLPKRVRKPKMSDIGVSFDGDDRAWLYRDSARGLWEETPGALEWAKKVLQRGN